MQEVFDGLVQLYYEVYPYMDKIHVNIVITDDLNRETNNVRPDYEHEFTEKDNQYNGRMIPPKDPSDSITILMDLNRIRQYTEDHSYTWVGTFAHEFTHAIDFCRMYNKDELNSYQPIETRSSSKYTAFILWSEYHARKLGYYFLRYYLSLLGALDCEEDQLIKHIETYEWPLHKKSHFDEYHSSSDGYSQTYVTMQLLGRYSVWCDLFPTYFNERALSEEYRNTPWMGHLFSFLRRNEDFERIYENYDEMISILKENWQIEE